MRLDNSFRVGRAAIGDLNDVLKFFLCSLESLEIHVFTSRRKCFQTLVLTELQYRLWINLNLSSC